MVGSNTTIICDNSKKESLCSWGEILKRLKDTRNFHSSSPYAVWAGMGQKVTCLALPDSSLLRSWYKLRFIARPSFMLFVKYREGAGSQLKRECIVHTAVVLKLNMHQDHLEHRWLCPRPSFLTPWVWGGQGMCIPVRFPGDAGAAPLRPDLRASSLRKKALTLGYIKLDSCLICCVTFVRSMLLSLSFLICKMVTTSTS